MRSRREQVEAHRFITSRMNQALVLANPDSIERPLRRIGVSIFASVMVLALVFGGFAIATLFGKGNALPVAGSIITIKGSNAVYVYITKDGKDETDENPARLWPVTNYTSALLLVKPGSDGKPPVQDLKPDSLKGLLRGSFTIGIQGIPPQPPDPEELLQGENWNVCSMPRTPNGTADFQLTQLVVADLPGTTMLGEDRWLLAKTAVGEDETQVVQYYLLWNGRKYEVGNDESTAVTVMSALGLDADNAVSLNESMLRTIPDGAPLIPELREEFGQPSTVDDNGTVINYGRPVDDGSGLYVLMKTETGEDGFAPITPTMARLLESRFEATLEIDPTTRSQVETQADYMPRDYPDEILTEGMWTGDTERPAVCAVYDPSAQNEQSTVIDIAMYDDAPDLLAEHAESVEYTPEGDIFSDVKGLEAQTVIPQGRAVLADSRTDDGATISGFTYMVSDQGIRHGIADEGVTDSTQKMLGYDGETPVSVPDTMIHLIPVGNALDPREARKQIVQDDAEAPVYQTEPEPSGEAGG
jgi:type VII secretion protein EccB